MTELAGHAFTVPDANVLRCECGWSRRLPLSPGYSSVRRAAAICTAIDQHETEVPMPYDPRMMQQRGGMMPSQQASFDPYAPPENAWWQQGSQRQQGAQFAPAPAPQQPKQWYEGLPAPSKDPYGKDPKTGKPQPTLLDMLMGTGGTGPDKDRPSLGPIPSMGMANMPASVWSQFTGMFGGGTPR